MCFWTLGRVNDLAGGQEEDREFRRSGETSGLLLKTVEDFVGGDRRADTVPVRIV
jgi:hypothetical protein